MHWRHPRNALDAPSTRATESVQRINYKFIDFKLYEFTRKFQKSGKIDVKGMLT